MLSGSVIFASAFAYMLLLLRSCKLWRPASQTKQDCREGQAARLCAEPGRSTAPPGPISVASALRRSRGLEFTGIYIGPILMFTFGMPLIRRIVRLAKTEKLTSVADFVAARYGKTRPLRAIVALISLVGGHSLYRIASSRRCRVRSPR